MILVTGATGHVGRAVVSRLASLGHDVVAMVRDVQAASRRLPSGIALRVADYEDASALKRGLAGIDDMVLISYLTWASARLDDPWPCAFSTLCASIAEGRYSQVSKDFTAITGREPESFRDFLLRATSGSPDCIAGSPFRERHRS